MSDETMNFDAVTYQEEQSTSPNWSKLFSQFAEFTLTHMNELNEMESRIATDVGSGKVTPIDGYRIMKDEVIALAKLEDMSEQERGEFFRGYEKGSSLMNLIRARILHSTDLDVFKQVSLTTFFELLKQAIADADEFIFSEYQPEQYAILQDDLDMFSSMIVEGFVKLFFIKCEEMYEAQAQAMVKALSGQMVSFENEGNELVMSTDTINVDNIAVQDNVIHVNFDSKYPSDQTTDDVKDVKCETHQCGCDNDGEVLKAQKNSQYGEMGCTTDTDPSTDA